MASTWTGPARTATGIGGRCAGSAGRHRRPLGAAARGQRPGTTLPELLTRLAPVDLVLVEGFKTHPFAKLEVHRPALGKPPIWRQETGVVAVACDAELDVEGRVLLPLNQPPAVADWIAGSMLGLPPVG